MITVIFGENSFEIARALERLEADFDGRAEKVDGAELSTKQLPDLLMGATLFSERRLVIIKNLATNTTTWNEFPDWLPRLSDDIHLVLVDTKLDKRTRTYKELLKLTKPQEYALWTERDSAKAEAWLAKEAAAQSVKLDRSSIRAVIERVGVDQWQLLHALDKLAVLDKISPATIEQVIEARPSENVFGLLEAALDGNVAQVARMIRTLQMTEDAYMVFGLLVGQVFQLAALAAAEKPSAEVAKDIAAHPFVLSKLQPKANRLGRAGARKCMKLFADCDQAMKSTGADPWLLVEGVLVKVASTVR